MSTKSRTGSESVAEEWVALRDVVGRVLGSVKGKEKPPSEGLRMVAAR